MKTLLITGGDAISGDAIRGKIKVGKNFLSTYKYYVEQGWQNIGFTKKDAEGSYWFVLELRTA